MARLTRTERSLFDPPLRDDGFAWPDSLYDVLAASDRDEASDLSSAVNAADAADLSARDHLDRDGGAGERSTILITVAADISPADLEVVLASVGADDACVLRAGGTGDSSLVKIRIPPSLSPERALDILAGQPLVIAGEEDAPLFVDVASNDPAYADGRLWGMYGDTTTPANSYGSQAGEAWSVGYTGSAEVVVGVIDTGIDYTHTDLYLNIWINNLEIPSPIRMSLTDANSDGIITFLDLNDASNSLYVGDFNNNSRIDAGDILADSRWENGYDDDGNGYVDDLIGWDFANGDNDPYDDHGHGTHVAGTIAAMGGNGYGVAGVTWSTQLVALKFLSSSGAGTTSGAVQSIDYFTAASQASVVQRFVATNNSWGGGGSSTSLRDAVGRGAVEDILFVAAAGNGGYDGFGDNNDIWPQFPSNYDTTSLAGYDAVIAVASLTSTGQLSSFSNYGAVSVDIAAPGSSIYSTLPGGYGMSSGTSMATPHVTGAIALYASLTTAGAAEIKANLLASATATPSLSGAISTGGRLDIGAFLEIDTTADDVRNGTAGDDLFKMARGGNDRVSGGAGLDTFVFGDEFSIGDRVDGGDGYWDQLVLQGSYVGPKSIVFEAEQLVAVEVVRLLSGGNGYALATVDATVAAGSFLFIAASELTSGEALTFDGSAERDGHLAVLGGAAADVLRGGAQMDLLDGGLAADQMIGGAGDDYYVVDDTADVVLENAGEGTDSVVKAGGAERWLQQKRASAYQLPDHVEGFISAYAPSDLAMGQGVRGNALDNSIRVSGGADYVDVRDGGEDTVIAGEGRDVIYYGEALTAADRNLGGGSGGDARGDLLVIQGGSYTGFTLGAENVDGIEQIRISGAANNQFGSAANANYHYKLYSVDANVKSGERLVVNAQTLAAGESLDFDGSAEADGRFQILGGAGNDTLRGGAGADHLLGREGNDTLIGEGGTDLIRGGLGQDMLVGGAGADTFTYAAGRGGKTPGNPDGTAYAAPAESTGVAYDILVGLDFAEDRVNLPVAVSGWSSTITGGRLDAAGFDADLAAALDAALHPDTAILFEPDTGTLAGKIFLIVDGNGNGAYDSGLDWVFELRQVTGAIPPASEFFI